MVKTVVIGAGAMGLAAAHYALQLGHDGADKTARDTLAAFRDAHITLVEGKQGLPGIFCQQLRDAYFGTMRGDQIIREFIALAESTLDAIGTTSRRAPALLDELVRSATPLLSVLNALTLVYEEQSKRHALQQRRQMHELMGDIKTIAREARMVAFNAQIVAAHLQRQNPQIRVELQLLLDPRLYRFRFGPLESPHKEAVLVALGARGRRRRRQQRHFAVEMIDLDENLAGHGIAAARHDADVAEIVVAADKRRRPEVRAEHGAASPKDRPSEKRGGPHAPSLSRKLRFARFLPELALDG